MELFELKEWNLVVSEVAWGLEPFKKILIKDKSKNKESALKEMLFIYYFADIKSDYFYITIKEDRINEIKKDVGLDASWKIDPIIENAINFYIERSTTVLQSLYESAVHAAFEISNYLKNTKTLLEERTEKGVTVTKLNEVTNALSKIPSIMKDLTEAHKELVKEQKNKEGRMKGSKELSMFEDGL